MSFETDYGYYKEGTKFSELIISIEFDDPFSIENHSQ